MKPSNTDNLENPTKEQIKTFVSFIDELIKKLKDQKAKIESEIPFDPPYK
jgi:hypothetical protein